MGDTQIFPALKNIGKPRYQVGENRIHGLMRGGGLAKAATVRLVRHRQTKRAETDKPGLMLQKPALYST